jgi:Heterokaryon incompatibility protein (HET)
VGFWIDIICVSMDEVLKKQAIVQMSTIYREASAVMVFGKFIEGLSTDTGSLTVIWHINTSNWYRRLWTLQGGILNKLTFVILADDFPPLECSSILMTIVRP